MHWKCQQFFLFLKKKFEKAADLFKNKITTFHLTWVCVFITKHTVPVKKYLYPLWASFYIFMSPVIWYPNPVKPVVFTNCHLIIKEGKHQPGSWKHSYVINIISSLDISFISIKLYFSYPIGKYVTFNNFIKSVVDVDGCGQKGPSVVDKKKIIKCQSTLVLVSNKINTECYSFNHHFKYGNRIQIT